MSTLSSCLRAASAAFLCSVPLVLTGCSALNVTASSPIQTTGLAIKGTLHGGSQPVAGAKIYLLAASSAGYPTATTNPSVSLLTSATGSTADSVGYYVTSDSNANFSITGDYTCTAGQQVYILAVGGDPGLGTTNSHIGLATVLGNCPSSGDFAASIPNLVVDEVTTVAAAYALSGFAVDDLHIGAPSSSSLTASHPVALAGITNAFANFALLADVTSGSALSTTAAGALVPQSEINTLANILSSCVNSSGDLTVTTSNCYTLFNNATSDGTTSGTVPTDTFTAAINIAHNPGANISSLCSLQSGVGAPYQPALPCSTNSLPNDFTISLRYPNTGTGTFTDLAADSSGDILATSTGGYVAHYVAASAYAETVEPFTGSLSSIAIGDTGTVYLANSAGNTLIVTNLAGSSPVSTSTAGLSTSGPAGLSLSYSESYLYACDTASPGGVIVAKVGVNGAFASLSETTTDMSAPVKTAVAFNDDVFVANSGAAALGEMSSTGTALASRAMTYSNNQSSVAIDQSGIPWVTSISGGAAGQISPTGTDITGTTSTFRYTSGTSGQYYPKAVAIDGANRAWMANTYLASTHPQSISEFNSTAVGLSPTIGFLTSNSDNSSLAAIAIDSSGNLWTIGSTHLYEFVGAASPVATPIVRNIKAPYLTPASKP